MLAAFVFQACFVVVKPKFIQRLPVASNLMDCMGTLLTVIYIFAGY
jgi:hypothetical protein